MRALAAWREHDIARAIHPADRAAIASTESARTLVLELLAAPGDVRPKPPRDLFNACAALGRLLADAGASPTLAALTMDGAAAAICNADPARLSSARAALVEAYVAARADADRKLARRAWEYPACAARLDKETAAVVAGFPMSGGDGGDGGAGGAGGISGDNDAEELSEWAARVALAASKDGIKTVVLSGPDAARRELAAALDLVGIEARADLLPRKEPWLKLPWRK
jgi:hypothetical protein